MDYYGLNQNAAAKTALQRAVQLKLPPNLDTEAKRVLALLSEIILAPLPKWSRPPAGRSPFIIYNSSFPHRLRPTNGH